MQCLSNSRMQRNYSDEQVREAEERLQVKKMKAELEKTFLVLAESYFPFRKVMRGDNRTEQLLCWC